MLTFLSVFLGVLLIVVGIIIFVSAPEAWCFAVIGVGVLFLVYAFFRIKKRLASKAEEKELGYKKNYKKVTDFKGICFYGLSDGEAECCVTMYKNNIVFKVNGHESNLLVSKVTSAVVKESTELVDASTSSVVMGALLYGALGAFVASRPRASTTYSLIINYQSEGEQKYIGIAADKNQKSAMELVALTLNRHTHAQPASEL